MQMECPSITILGANQSPIGKKSNRSNSFISARDREQILHGFNIERELEQYTERLKNEGKIEELNAFPELVQKENGYYQPKFIAEEKNKEKNNFTFQRRISQQTKLEFNDSHLDQLYDQILGEDVLAKSNGVSEQNLKPAPKRRSKTPNYINLQDFFSKRTNLQCKNVRQLFGQTVPENLIKSTIKNLQGKSPFSKENFNPNFTSTLKRNRKSLSPASKSRKKIQIKLLKTEVIKLKTQIKTKDIFSLQCQRKFRDQLLSLETQLKESQYQNIYLTEQVKSLEEQSRIKHTQILKVLQRIKSQKVGDEAVIKELQFKNQKFEVFVQSLEEEMKEIREKEQQQKCLASLIQRKLEQEITQKDKMISSLKQKLELLVSPKFTRKNQKTQKRSMSLPKEMHNKNQLQRKRIPKSLRRSATPQNRGKGKSSNSKLLRKEPIWSNKFLSKRLIQDGKGKQPSRKQVNNYYKKTIKSTFKIDTNRMEQRSETNRKKIFKKKNK